MRRVALLALTLALGGCLTASGPADRHFAAGDYARAAAAYEKLLETPELGSSGQAHALYRLALTHLHPESPVRDAAKAIELLETVVAEHPQTAVAVEAGLVLDLQKGLLRAAAELDQRREAIRELQAERVALQEAWGKALGDAAEQEEEARRLSARIGRIEAQTAELREEIRRREDELRRLKAIDLGPPR